MEEARETTGPGVGAGWEKNKRNTQKTKKTSRKGEEEKLTVGIAVVLLAKKHFPLRTCRGTADAEIKVLFC